MLFDCVLVFIAYVYELLLWMLNSRRAPRVVRACCTCGNRDCGSSSHDRFDMVTRQDAVVCVDRDSAVAENPHQTMPFIMEATVHWSSNTAPADDDLMLKIITIVRGRCFTAKTDVKKFYFDSRELVALSIMDGRDFQKVELNIL